MASSNSQITKPQCGCFKRAEPPDVNINTGVQSINSMENLCLDNLVYKQRTKELYCRLVVFKMAVHLRSQGTEVMSHKGAPYHWKK